MRPVPAWSLPLFAVTLLCASPIAISQEGASTRVVEGNVTRENIPDIPPALIERLDRYQNTRSASFSGWTADGCMLIETRFAEQAQAHRVCQPLGMREQLTFSTEGVGVQAAAPTGSGLDGFVYDMDRGGDEFHQLYWFDLASRDVRRLTEGGRTRNTGALFSDDGRWLAWSSNARNGSDVDIWVMDFDSGEARPMLTEGGAWFASDFSPDGRKLLAIRYVSINETYPAELDLNSGRVTYFPVDGGKAAITGMRYAPDGRGVYYISDEPIGDRAQEFRTLRHHVPGKPVRIISGDIDWDVVALAIADSGEHLAFVTSEDGIHRLHLRSLPSLEPVELPSLPAGVIGNQLAFSPDGLRLAMTINTATSPSDVFVADLAARTLTPWTRSEVGGLDPAAFATPTLIRYPTFDVVDGEPRTIPAFYYRPKPSGDDPLPVVMIIHGGPESQSLPTFSSTIQYLVNELGVAVLLPNVRGSDGYGKTYLQLDNATLREDSVKDIGALLDWIAEQPELDAERVGVYGGSYGGYMVLASLVHYSDRIRAGIDVVGISHFGTFLQNTEDYRRDLRRAEYGDERDPQIAAFFDEISPLNNADRIDAPLFVAQGRNDPRVPYTESEQIIEAVRENGQPVWFLMFDDEGHGFSKKSNRDLYTAAAMLFLERHLLDAGTPDADQ